MILVAHSFYLRRDLKQVDRCKPYSPLMTLITAALLRKAGLEVVVFDATFEPGVEAFASALATHDPDVVLLIEDGFNFLTKMCTETRRQDALAMVSMARARGCRVAANGPDAADNVELYVAAGADEVLPGEGEYRALQFVMKGMRREMPSQLVGIDALPPPAWDLIDVEAYRRAWLGAHGEFSWNMAASRGCPYPCNWCAKPTFGRRYAQRAAEDVAEELSLIKAQIGPDNIWFADDIFGMSTWWVADFAQALERRDAAVPFMIQSRCNLMTPAMAASLKSAGCVEVWLGVESGAQHVLEAMDKGATVEAARSATRNLRSVGIRVGWFLQLGYPGEEWEDILSTRDLVRQESPDDIGVSVAYPLPGTVFHDRVAAELGARRNWRDTADLAMLFEGAFDTEFYRLVRDALHVEAAARAPDDLRWCDLARRAALHRTGDPVRIGARA